ncbi:MAG: site-specific integrase [Flavobacteriales bacterium]|nr:site-specific integrase [Flavobacteriales bacterium]
MGYAIPELKSNKSGCYVDYYVRNPVTGKLQRMRIKLNRFKGQAARLAYGRQLVEVLTVKLREGWTPWQSVPDPMAEPLTVSLSHAFDQWQRIKAKHTRHSSPYSYSSMGAIFLKWAVLQGLGDKSPAEFTRSVAMRFMQYLSDTRSASNRTWNNYRVFGAMFFGYCVQRDYTKTNPFKDIKALRTQGKSREYLTDGERLEMMHWILNNEPDFMLPCILVFGSLIRPGELRRLRIEHVDIANQVIMLPAETTKTGVERTPAIPNWMMPYLYKAEIHRAPSRSWLIGSRFTPGDTPLARNSLNRIWTKMREELRWPSSKQLYSLRDTGIIQLLRDGVDLLHVMQQAGHTEISTTNKYLKHAFPNGPAEVREKATSLYVVKGLFADATIA